ncbi:MAG: DUF87 domain-containing protein [Clostridia bacterium]|nr:DUF87 domain-containing protein [Clostridia bacterium]
MKGGIIIIKNFLSKNKKEIKKSELEQGFFSEQDFLSPSYINLENPKYIEIENKYYSGIVIVNYNREQNDLILKNIIDSNINLNISCFYEKQDTYKTIKDLTYHIGNNGLNLKQSNESRQDIEIVASSYNDAKYIRKQMQVNNEDLYFLYNYIMIFSKDKNELEYLLNKVEGIIQSRGMQTRRTYFRQEQAFLSCIPTMINKEELKVIGKRNILTSSLVSTYPFISSSIFDENGIFMGININNNSLVFIDRYDANKYKNSNMCIFGTSGAGKSYYTKLIILRCRIQKISQYIIDPDREYVNICKRLNGTLIKIGPTSNTHINILDIRKESIEDSESGYLATKIGKLIGFFNLIFGNINEEEKGELEEILIRVYNKKGITFDDGSLYKNSKFKNSKEMPILEDLYNELESEEKYRNFKIKLIPFIKGSLNFFNNYTNIELKNKLIVADVYELGEENLKYGMYLFTDLFWDKIKYDRSERKAIYIDEIWRLIGVTSNKNVASFIYKIFKTIRKYGGSAVAITQDISDLFSLENGTYGKSILNNSSIKSFFSLEEENIKVLEKYANLSEKEKIEIKSLKRGETLMFVGNDHVLVKIEANELEDKVIRSKGEYIEKSINSYR